MTMSRGFGLGTAGLIGLLLAGCANKPREGGEGPTDGGPLTISDAHLPPFARLRYEQLARENVVAIAMREWRLFGQPIDDDPPDTRPEPLPNEKPERLPGLWQRVGEYWWFALEPSNPHASWTGKHDEYGRVFPARRDGDFAWSAAFISYVMRVAGAGSGFPYASSHTTYINLAKEMAQGQTAGWIMFAERPESYAPRPGDLICTGRGRAVRLRYDDLPTRHSFPAHCAIVVAGKPGEIAVVGGNVDDAVTLTHVPTTQDGKLATPDGTVVDTRYPWLTVLRINYPVESVPLS